MDTLIDPDLKRHEKRLKRAVEDARQYKKNDLLSDKCLELAELYSRESGDFDKAKPFYEEALTASKKSNLYKNICLSLRNLGEIADKKFDFTKATNYMAQFMWHAKKNNDICLIQEAFHMNAFVWLNYAREEKGSEALSKALNIALQGWKYLESNAVKIDTNPELNKDADSKSRKMRLAILLSDIYTEMAISDSLSDSDLAEAKKYNDMACEFYQNTDDFENHFICLRTRLSLIRTRKEIFQTLSTMRRLSNRYPPDYIKTVKIEVEYYEAREKLNFKQVEVALNDLWALHKKLENLSMEFYDNIEDKVEPLLIFAYKLKKRIEMAESSETNREGKMRIYEKLGDDACEFDLFHLAMDMYRSMAANSIGYEDQRRALTSLAMTARDLKLYDKALEWYQRLLNIETKLNLSTDQLNETRILIAEMTSKTSIHEDNKLTKFEETLNSLQLVHQKQSLLECELKFLQDSNSDKYKNIIESIKLQLDEYRSSSRDLSVEPEKPGYEYQDDFEIPNDAIMVMIKDEMKEKSVRKQFENERDAEVNNAGETRLHIAAREGNLDVLKLLIEEYHYNVNREDNAGWTPLSEAVSRRDYGCVKYLLSKGAKVNTLSNENAFLMDENNEKCSAVRISPLMESCNYGDVNIARLLFEHGASVTEMSEDRWTAVDYLKNYLKHHEDDPNATKIKLLVKKMEDKQRSEGFEVRPTPPTIRSDKKSLADLQNRLSQRRNTHVDENKKNFHEYQRVLNNLRRNRKIHDRSANSNPEIGLDTSDPFLEDDFEQDQGILPTDQLSPSGVALDNDQDEDPLNRDDELFKQNMSRITEQPKTSTQVSHADSFEYFSDVDEQPSSSERKRKADKEASPNNSQKRKKSLAVKTLIR